MYRLSLASLVIISVLFSTPARSETERGGPSILRALVEEGLKYNQELQSMQARAEAAKELIDFAGSLEDPRLGVGLLNLPTDTFDFDQEPMTQKQISLAQKFPWFGKRDLRSKFQSLKAGQEFLLLEAKKLELVRKITTNYYELGLIAKNLEINARLKEMVSQLLRVAETKYASGVGLQQNVLQAQVEMSKLLDEKIVLQKKRRTIEDRINALINRESFAAIDPPKSPRFPDMPHDVKTLQILALKRNPWLGVKALEIERAAVDIKMAKKDYWPDMDVKVSYGLREGDQMGQKRADFLSGAVVFKVPLWKKDRQDKRYAASKNKLNAAQRSHQNLTNALPHRVDALVTEITETQKNYRLYADALMLQAEQWAHSALASYEVGKVNFNTMITAQIRLLRFELQAERYLYRILQKKAELDEVVGGPFKGGAKDDGLAMRGQRKGQATAPVMKRIEKANLR